MAELGLFSEAEARFLRALTDEGVEFLVVGLSAAALQGAPAVTQDIDLWFRDLTDPGIRKALRRVGGTYVSPTGSALDISTAQARPRIFRRARRHGSTAAETPAATRFRNRLRAPSARS